MSLILQTERLRLRSIQTADSAFILKLVNTEEWIRFIGDRNIHSIEQAEIYIQKIIDNPSFEYMVIELKSMDTPVGLITFLKREDYDAPDLGFALLPAYVKLGIATEASSAYMKKMAVAKGHPKIIAITRADNVKSIKLLEKLGFVFESLKINQGDKLLKYVLHLNA